MLYHFFYYLLKLTTKLYFKKIRFYHPENIAPDQPLIICANHGNSFMDAILLAVSFKRKLHFLARADAFNSPFKHWFLSKINMMPIYRIRDGREALKNNDEIFFKCQEILNQNGAILIFPEGNCVVEKRLRTFKAGFVQMAFASEHPKTQILPVTLNYNQPYQFYTEVCIDFREPIHISALKKESGDDYIAFSKLALAKVMESIAKKMLILTENEDDFYEEILEIYRNSNTLLDKEFIENQLLVIEQLNQIKIDNPQLYNTLKMKVLRYKAIKEEHAISDLALAALSSKPSSKWKWLCFPLYFLGFLMDWIPSTITKHLTRKMVKEAQFLSAVRMVLALFVFPIYFFSIATILNIWIKEWLLSLAMILISAYIHRSYFEYFRLLKEKNKLRKQPELKHQLFDLRSEILAKLNLLP
ncbi:MAG: 1-acyl-sn-glycerol-3-phosphate acyltransferase [Sphingobacteriales bacterium]|nr:1-acyl-sn-glycerol-3-phosphate acyltransferase [Sphingobacteriales bacterium]